MGRIFLRQKVREELARGKQGAVEGFAVQGIGKKAKGLSAGRLRAMFPAETAVLSDQQVLQRAHELLKKKFGGQ